MALAPHIPEDPDRRVAFVEILVDIIDAVNLHDNGLYRQQPQAIKDLLEASRRLRDFEAEEL